MEIVSKEARKLLKNMAKVANNFSYVIYQEHSKMIDKDILALRELVLLKFVKSDQEYNFRVTDEGLIFLRQYKSYIRQVCLTSFWIPLLVSMLGTAFTLTIKFWLFTK